MRLRYLIFEQSIIEVNDTGTMLVKMAGDLVILQGIRFSMWHPLTIMTMPVLKCAIIEYDIH